MNGFDITLWAVAINLYILAEDPARKKLWIWLGIVLGLALLNKLSGLWLFAGLGLATLLTPRRIELRVWQPWIAVLLAIGIASPHLIWQINHGFPTLEFLENAAKYKLAPTPPWTILGVQIAVTNPAFAIMWVVGVVLAWRNREWRGLAIPFTMVLLMLLICMRTRENYLAPAYAFVVPAGAIWLGAWLDECRWHRAVYGTIAGLLTVFTLSLALPILPPAVLVKVVSVNSIPVPTAEKGSASQMQGLSDMFGWRIMAREARGVWQSLPEGTRFRTPVLGMNYGESAAIEFFGKTTPEMPVIGIHNNYWLWGYGDWDGEQIVVVGHADAEFRSQFREWKIVKTLDNPWAVPEEASAPISIARGLKVPVKQFWMDSKRFR